MLLNNSISVVLPHVAKVISVVSCAIAVEMRSVKRVSKRNSRENFCIIYSPKAKIINIENELTNDRNIDHYDCSIKMI